MNKMGSTEEVRRSGAYHEAAHAVADVVLGHTVRYVSIATKGSDYQDICVTAVTHVEFEDVGRIPAPWNALGHAISSITGNMAMFREAGTPYHWDSWQKIMRDCEDIEALGDPDELGDDTMTIREYCEAAAHLGQMARMPAPSELPEGAPPLPRIPSTGEEACEMALRDAERLVDKYWWAIKVVAERLMEKGYLTGAEVEAIVYGSESSDEEKT